MFDRFIKLCNNNCEYFSKDKSENGEKIHFNSIKIVELLEKSSLVLIEIESFAGEYDFDDENPGNGYRSFIFVFNAGVTYIENICKSIAENREKFFFRKSSNAKEIKVCRQMIESLTQIGEGLIEMHKISEPGKLFSKRCHHDNIITRAAKVINQECFYGRATGFQYYESLRSTVKFAASSMASYSEFYFSNKNIFSKTFDLIVKSRKYFLDSELCAQRVCDIFQNADIHFLSSFLNLCESKLMQIAVSFSGYGVEVNRTFEIKAEPMKIYSKELDRIVEIPVPVSHVGEKPIQCRLISAHRRIDMLGEEIDCSKLIFSEASDGLIIHIHGGGWISQSSKTHEIYLREWAVKLDVPILSIDYSLAPEAPFPRALEEVFYIYCWALRNPELVGSNLKNVVICGDSAGGNLATACVIKCIEMGVPKPTGLFTAYSAFLVNLVKTPARFMGLIDSFLPFSFVMRILKTYGSAKSLTNPKISSKEPENHKKFQSNGIPKAPDSEFVFQIPRNHLLSPHWAPESVLKEFPPTKILSMITDPCLDECVDFAKKLRSLKVDTQIEILGGLVHGFLSFTQVSKECHDGSLICMGKVAELLNINLEM